MMDTRVHEAVLAAGVAETGCTIHQVTEDVDAGPIVLQKRCPVLPGDTADTLKARVQALEQAAFIEVLKGWRV
jgi:folate-dependent phosphoribosylglycinamide formyltransferase PurN